MSVADNDGLVGCLDAPGIVLVVDESCGYLLVDVESASFSEPGDGDASLLGSCGAGVEGDERLRGDGEDLQLVDEWLVSWDGEGGDLAWVFVA